MPKSHPQEERSKYCLEIYWLALLWGNITLGNINYTTDVNIAKYGSGICLGEQLSLGEICLEYTFLTPSLFTVMRNLHSEVASLGEAGNKATFLS